MKQYAPSCDRNKHYILELLKEVLPRSGVVLETGSGTGQHTAFFASALPALEWQPTDLEENISSIKSWCKETGGGNIRSPEVLDLRSPEWPVSKVDALISINTIHIVSWPLVENLFRGAGKVVTTGGVMYCYGPYRYRDKPLEPSNIEFDVWLKQRDPESGIRQFEDVNRLAQANGFVLQGDRAMPANNRSLWWIKE